MKLSLVVLGIFAISAFAQEPWAHYDARAKGSGGARVASVNDESAFYWNPAAVGKLATDHFGLNVNAGAGVSGEGDIVSKVDGLADAVQNKGVQAILQKVDAGQALTPAELQTLFDIFGNQILGLDEKGQGILVDAQGGLAFGVNLPILGKTIISYSDHIFGALRPVVDFSNLRLNVAASGQQQIQNLVGNGNDRSAQFTNGSSQALADQLDAILVANGFPNNATTQNQAEELVFQAEQAGLDTGNPGVQQVVQTVASTSSATTTTSASQNDSGVIIKGLELRELGFNFAIQPISNVLFFGVNPKFVEARTFYSFQRYSDLDDGDKLKKDAKDAENAESQSNFNVDAGVLLNVADWLRLGLTGRNLLEQTYKFNIKDGESARVNDTYVLKPQYRAGAGIVLSNRMSLSVDYDISVNKSQLLEGFESQEVGAGLMLNPPILPIKLYVGANENMKALHKDIVLSAGLSLALGDWFELNLGGSMGTKKVKIETGDDGEKEIRERASFGASLTISF